LALQVMIYMLLPPPYPTRRGGGGGATVRQHCLYYCFVVIILLLCIAIMFIAALEFVFTQVKGIVLRILHTYACREIRAACSTWLSN